VLEKSTRDTRASDFLAVAAPLSGIRHDAAAHLRAIPPWTTLEGYNDLLDVIAQQDLCENVAPIQLAIRLLIPAGSRLLELPDVRAMVGTFDSAALIFPWKHEDARLDALCHEISELVQRGEKLKLTRTEIFFAHPARGARGSRAGRVARRSAFAGEEHAGAFSG